MSARNAAKTSSSNSGSTKRGSKAEYKREDNREPALSPGMRDDLIGIGLVLVGILLFLMVVIPQQAFVSAGIAGMLRHVFGIGAFVLPFAFVAWGISFFLKPQDSHLGRFVVGVTLILIALMGIFSCVTYQVCGCTEPAQLFSEPVLVGGGGYVGSGVSWCLVSALGLVISYVIYAFVIIVGLVLAGFSISSAFLFARNLAQERRKDRLAAKELEEGFEPQVRKGAGRSYSEEDASGELPRADETVVLGDKRGRKPLLPTFSAGSFDQEDDYEQACQDELFDGESPSDAAAPTQVLPSKRKGAKTVKLSRKGKDEPAGAAQEDAKTVKLGAAPAVAEGAAPAATEGFVLPDLSLLKVSGKRNRNALNAEYKDTAALLQQTLEEFSVPARVVGWLAGPTVTLFKVELPSGVKLSKLTGLADDIALALAASSVRIAQIPNTSLVGVEIPNKQRQDVLLGDIIPSCGNAPLDMAIGEDIDGNGVCVNLAKMPHLLIGGTTGSGKSVCINSMIMSIITRATPAEVRMILIDPKRIEFSQYNGIPHLYVPVVTEPKEAAAALRWGVVEMERRLKVFETVGARNIGFYNQKIQNGELDSEEGERPKEMPFIVIVIDELSDLMMAAGKDVEDSIVRISQLARAAGIHLIVATQRPSSNVVTGMIKANITNRIALLVATGVDSRVILDASGAEKLVGHGDMLFNKPEWGKPKRIQGCFVSDDEINQVVAHLKEQGTPEYHPEILQMKVEGGSASGASSFEDIQEDDPLLWEAADAVVQSGLGSTSMLQRRLKVGYARAGRIMDMLENKGIVGPPDGSRAREVLIDSIEDLEAIKAFEMADGEGF
ncbi:MAG: DNA translocase FtsK 4TM domain-containing protein [Coriobacteriales bacterium]